MKPFDKTKRGQTDTLTFEYELEHAPMKVWRALTEPSLLSRWLLPIANLHLEPGAAFTFQAPPLPGWDGAVHCQLLESEPYRLLRYSWVVGDMDTVVTFTLEPTDVGTRLHLEHSGFRADQKHNFGGARYGWNQMLERLFGVLASDA